MEKLELDKSTWGEGPWQHEPDRLEWCYKGFPCLIQRNHYGVLCGYVGVNKTHPYYQKHYDEVELSAHGDLTYSDFCYRHICHTPLPGEEEDVYWFGFDCAHGFDLVPAREARRKSALHNLYSEVKPWRTYKTIDIVKIWVEDLADQLEQKAKEPNSQPS